MNYFKELLESYSRLKKRDLTLLEAKPSAARVKQKASTEALTAAQSEAKQAVDAALKKFTPNSQTGQSSVSQFPYQSKSNPEKIVYFFPSKTPGNVSFSLGDPNGFKLTSKKEMSRLVNFLVGKAQPQQQADQNKTTGQPAEITPEEKAKADYIKRYGYPPGDKIDQIFPGVGKFFRKIGENISSIAKDLVPFAAKVGSTFMKSKLSEKFIETFYGGGNKYNIEHGLTNVTLVTKSVSKGGGVLIEVGSLDKEESDLQRKMIAAGAERLQRATEIISKINNNPKSITREDIEELNSIFKLRGNCRTFLSGGHSQECRIMIATGGDGVFEGIIHSDTHGELKALIALAIEKTKDFEKTHGFPGVNIESAKLYTDANGRSAIVHLSKVTEIATVLHSHYANCNKNSLPPEYCKKRSQLILDKYSEKMEMVSDLVFQYNRQLEKGEETSIIADEEFERMLDFMGVTPEAKEKLRHIIKLTKRLSESTLQVRNPDLIINIGEDTGFGKRADNVELYSSEEKLLESLKKQYSDEEIEKYKEDNTIKCGVTAKDAFGSASDEYELAKSHNVVNDSNSYCTFNVSEKNYVSFADGVKAGSQRTSTITAILSGKIKDVLQQKLVKSARAAMAKCLGFKASDMKACSDYHEGMENKVKDILGPLQKTKQVIVDGKPKTVWDPEQTAKSVSDQLRRSLDQNDCNREPYKSILQEAKKLEKDPKADPQQFLSKVANLAKQKNMQQDMFSSDPEVKLRARKYAASLLFSAGGATDGVMVNANAILDQKRYSYRQNEVFDYVQQAVNGDGDWEFKIDEKTGETMVANKNNPDEFISLSMQSVNSAEGFNSNYSANLSESMMKRLSRNNVKEIKDSQPPESVKSLNDSIVYTRDDLSKFVVKNKEIILELFKFITKDV